MSVLVPLKLEETNPESLAPFYAAIETEDEAHFLAASDSGLFDAFVPEWARMRGEFNTQHKTHDFTLDVHSAKVVCKTHHTQAFKALPRHWQRLTTLAAFFHDIAKNGGPASERLTLPPDPLHPIKGGAVARRHMQAWGYSLIDGLIVNELIRFHQVYGRMMIRDHKLKLPPTEQEYVDHALLFPDLHFLQALYALTEGDIRAVKANDAIFDARVEADLTRHILEVQHHINALNSTQPLLAPYYVTDLATGLDYLPISLELGPALYHDCGCGMEFLSATKHYNAQLETEAKIQNNAPHILLKAFVNPPQGYTTLEEAVTKKQEMNHASLADMHLVGVNPIQNSQQFN